MAVEGTGTRWFLAQVKPNAARIAERNLRRQGFATFLPLEDGTRRMRGRFVGTARPLFPGYVFVAFDPGAGFWRAINATGGITRLVSFGGMPAPVPPAIMEGLLDRCDPTGRLRPPMKLQPGDPVRLVAGPFAELMGRIEAIAPERRVWVLIEIMGRQTRVAVEPDQLAALPDRGPAPTP